MVERTNRDFNWLARTASFANSKCDFSHDLIHVFLTNSPLCGWASLHSWFVWESESPPPLTLLLILLTDRGGTGLAVTPSSPGGGISIGIWGAGSCSTGDELYTGMLIESRENSSLFEIIMVNISNG